MDPYQILGIKRDATAQNIRTAYRVKALEWHPDRNKSPEASEMMTCINIAYQILSDPAERRKYDANGTAFSYEPHSGANHSPESDEEIFEKFLNYEILTFDEALKRGGPQFREYAFRRGQEEVDKKRPSSGRQNGAGMHTGHRKTPAYTAQPADPEIDPSMEPYVHQYMGRNMPNKLLMELGGTTFLNYMQRRQREIFAERARVQAQREDDRTSAHDLRREYHSYAEENQRAEFDRIFDRGRERLNEMLGRMNKKYGI
ncbi:MAG: DnaJ domain-containing protein [Candidatus Aenigmarchaeota archaeon]|nr:DnaJ domain-containing protein [Candidatus Aenigmarchaeota archaeon]